MQSSYLVAKRTKQYGYAIRNIVAQASFVEAAGKKVTYLNIGNPPKYGFSPPESLIEAYQKAIRDKPAEYAPSAGVLEARVSIAEKLFSRGVRTDINSTFITDGASEAADLVYSSTLDEGDEVLVPSPGYPLYNVLAGKAGARQVFYHPKFKDGWKINIDELRSLVTQASKMIVVVNPNNPTGSIICRESLEEIIQFARENKLIILSDEVYSEMIFEGVHVPMASLADHDVPVITLDSMSKNFLAPGWRMGWLSITNVHLISEIRDAILKLADARLCANTPAQHVIKTAMEMPREYFSKYLLRLKIQRDLTFEMLTKMPWLKLNKPQGAFYAFPCVDLEELGFNTDEEFILDILKRTGILFVHGSGFGMNKKEGFFRIAFLPKKDILVDVYSRLSEYVEKRSYQVSEKFV